jgi:maleamate amidohydrolase
MVFKRAAIKRTEVIMSRIWDKFLTPNDLHHLAHSPRRDVHVGKKPAILSIDLYRGAFGDKDLPIEDGLNLWPAYCGPSSWAAIPQIQVLQKAARSSKIPLFHITGLSRESSGMPGWAEAIHGGERRKSGSTDSELDRYQRRLDILEEVGPQEGEFLLYKTAPSAFWGTPLMGQRHLLGIDTLFITGEVTSGCVRASVVDAASYRFKVHVVEDCVFDRHEACHAVNLFDMHQKYADVISIATALELIASFT